MKATEGPPLRGLGYLTSVSVMKDISRQDPAGLPDVAMDEDARGIALQAVGIRGLRFPARLLNNTGNEQSVVMTADLSIGLSADRRGAHMSRLVEDLYDWGSMPRRPADALGLLQTAADRQECDEAQAILRFDWFLAQPAPVTGAFGVLDIEVEWHGQLTVDGAAYTTVMTFPAMTLCPCSKAISDFGAHNQRAYLRLELESRSGEPLLPDDYLPLVNAASSMPVFPVLKRPDERAVTEGSYENPRFVEDVVRELALALRERPELAYFKIDCESVESIHNHNAFATYEESR